MLDVAQVVALHDDRTSHWHESEVFQPAPGWLGLVEHNHHCNFELWHEEDRARRDDMGFEYVYRAKRNIDRWNQQRNDFVERMDRQLVQVLRTRETETPANSETPGMIIDRLSILSLKLFHMREEAGRLSATAEHRSKCEGRVAVLSRQRADLAGALGELWCDCVDGRRTFKVYFQFKMYNDPDLNPALYGKTVDSKGSDNGA